MTLHLHVRGLQGPVTAETRGLAANNAWGRCWVRAAPPLSDSRPGAGWRGVGTAVPAENPREAASWRRRAADGGEGAKRPRNPQADATYLSEGNSTLEQQWAGRAHSYRFQ